MNATDPSLPEFRSRAPWWGADLQTVRNILMRDYPDLASWPGERVEIVAGNGDRLMGTYHPGGMPDAPLVALLHGLGGCEDSAYILAGAKMLLEEGFAVFRANLRGAGPSAPHCREMYHGGRSEDLELIFRNLRAQGLAGHGLYAIGYSLGGNALLKYLGEQGEGAGVARAVSVSAPLDLAGASRRLEALRNRAYQVWLLGRLREDWSRGSRDISDAQWRAIREARTIRDLDDRVVAPLNGYEGADDYYARCSSGGYIGRVRIPTLLLHARNDPWIPAAHYEEARSETPACVRVEVAPGGGHVGFHGRDGRWADLCAIRFFLAGL